MIGHPAPRRQLLGEARDMAWFMDLELSRRLERTEGTVGMGFVAVNQRLRPEIGAEWRDFDGTFAFFDGLDSPMTQTFGLGLASPATPERVAAIEEFFADKGAAVMHEVSPLAGVETAALLVDRGYKPYELSTVLVQGLDAAAEAPVAPGLLVRMIDEPDHAAWVETSIHGWAADPTFAPLMRQMATAAAANTAMLHFVVEREGTPIATGSMGLHEGVALLAGASTIPAGRGLGAQALILAARLTEARRRGCDLAMMVTAPGTTSQRNAERSGFRVAYTRTKWRLERRG
jgi:hypothetical protein